jgi:hypothetical protein
MAVYIIDCALKYRCIKLSHTFGCQKNYSEMRIEIAILVEEYVGAAGWTSGKREVY